MAKKTITLIEARKAIKEHPNYIGLTKYPFHRPIPMIAIFVVAIAAWLSFLSAIGVPVVSHDLYGDNTTNRIIGAFCLILIACSAYLRLDATLLQYKRIVAECSSGLFCPKCSKHIPTDQNWHCYQCGNYNNPKAATPPVDFIDISFIGHCSKCKTEPESLQCPHCKEIIPLVTGKLKGTPAKLLFSQVGAKQIDPKEASLSTHQTVVNQKKREIEIGGLDIEIAKNNVQLKGLSANLAPTEPKTFREKLLSKYNSKTELSNEIRRLKAEVDEEFIDDPDEREKRHRMIDEIAREFL